MDDFKISSENAQAAQLHLLQDLLANMHAQREMMAAVHSKLLAITEEEYLKRYDEHYKNAFDHIRNCLYAEYGHVDPASLNK